MPVTVRMRTGTRRRGRGRACRKHEGCAPHARRVQVQEEAGEHRQRARPIRVAATRRERWTRRHGAAITPRGRPAIVIPAEAASEDRRGGARRQRARRAARGRAPYHASGRGAGPSSDAALADRTGSRGRGRRIPRLPRGAPCIRGACTPRTRRRTPSRGVEHEDAALGEERRAIQRQGVGRPDRVAAWRLVGHRGPEQLRRRAEPLRQGRRRRPRHRWRTGTAGGRRSQGVVGGPGTTRPDRVPSALRCDAGVAGGADPRSVIVVSRPASRARHSR